MNYISPKYKLTAYAMHSHFLASMLATDPAHKLALAIIQAGVQKNGDPKAIVETVMGLLQARGV